MSLLRMVGVSAVLSCTLVTGYNALALGRAAEKPFQERLAGEDTASPPPGPALAPARTVGPGRPGACEGQAWPYYDQNCLKAHRADVPSSPVRWITLESRPEPATSTLTRAPQTVMAER